MTFLWLCTVLKSPHIDISTRGRDRKKGIGAERLLVRRHFFNSPEQEAGYQTSEHFPDSYGTRRQGNCDTKRSQIRASRNRTKNNHNCLLTVLPLSWATNFHVAKSRNSVFFLQHENLLRAEVVIRETNARNVQLQQCCATS